MRRFSLVSIEYRDILPELIGRRFAERSVSYDFDPRKGRAVFTVPDEEFISFVHCCAELLVIDIRPTVLGKIVSLLPVSKRCADIIVPAAEELIYPSLEQQYVDSVERDLFDFFKNDSVLIIEGFLRFREPELLEAWAMAADRAGEELHEFIRLSSAAPYLSLIADSICPARQSSSLRLVLFNDGTAHATDGDRLSISFDSIDVASLSAMLLCLSPQVLTVYDLTEGSGSAATKMLKALFGKRAVFFKSNS